MDVQMYKMYVKLISYIYKYIYIYMFNCIYRDWIDSSALTYSFMILTNWIQRVQDLAQQNGKTRYCKTVRHFVNLRPVW